MSFSNSCIGLQTSDEEKNIQERKAIQNSGSQVYENIRNKELEEGNFSWLGLMKEGFKMEVTFDAWLEGQVDFKMWR